MFPAHRQQRIVEILSEHGPLRSVELADLLEVSYETIRRDLNTLEAEQVVIRRHGGVQLPHARGSEASYLDRTAIAIREKAAIGRAAAALIKPGMTIMIDVGTTAHAVARAISDNYNGTIVTCSIPVAIELSDHRDVEVIVNAGRVRSGDLSISGSTADEFYRSLYPDIAFLGSGGIDERAGLTDYHLAEVTARRVIIANAEQSFVLADSSKFGRVAALRVCGLDAVSGLITDTAPPTALAQAITSSGGQVIVAPA